MKRIHLLGLLCLLLTGNVHAQLPPLSRPGGDFGQGGVGQNGGGQGIHGGAENGGPNNGGAGGGSMADFDSLMALIRQTVEPDSWDELGGTGSMSPYPAGVIVDAKGLVRDSDGSQGNADVHIDAIERMLGGGQPNGKPGDNAGAGDWQSPARIRCVSLRRMMQSLAAASMNGHAIAPDDALRFMAGLTKVEVVIVTPDDVILAGQVKGFEQVGGWMLDAETRLPTMSLMSLAVGLTAARTNTAFGCTIDPSTTGLQAAAAFGQRLVSGEIPMVTAADQLATALGRQKITVFGTPADHQVAYVMVEADRHMKRLALGDEPMPAGVRNYLQTIASSGDGTPPSELLLRLWFTSRSLNLRHANVESNQVIQIAGTPIQLSGENELALQTGQRGNVVVDPATNAFVNHFNENWMSIRSQYPIYGALESMYSATAIAELWKRKANTGDHETMQLAVMYFAAQLTQKLVPPREVDSIAVFHRYRRGKKRHQLLLASGGVKVSSEELIPMQSEAYPGIASLAKFTEQRPVDRWWWNATR